MTPIASLKQWVRASIKRGEMRRGPIAYRIGSYQVMLPAGHQLPNYQRQFPSYDTYFEEPLKRLESAVGSLTVIDVGANVGDTALAVTTFAPTASVICVEGSPDFLPYLRANTESVPSIRRVEAFVVPDDRVWRFTGDSSTGHLESLEGDGNKASDEIAHVTAQELCRMAEADVVVWKSDTDGLDLPILLAAWDDITERCAVLWLEFDPILTSEEYVQEFLKRLASLDRDVVIFDNFGLLMFRVSAPQSVSTLTELTAWLVAQYRSRSRRVYYFDVWLAPAALMDVMFR